MNIQYRLAWQRIHEMEERLGFPLVQTTVGGRGGGGATLTPEAHILIEHLRELFSAIDASAQELSVRHLGRLKAALQD